MAAQTGRTNEQYQSFWLDNSAGTLTDLSAYVKSIGSYGLKFDWQDVTGWSDAIKNGTVGRPGSELTVVFQTDTVVFGHITALNRQTPLTLDIRVGIRHAWQAGEPVFGITSSSTVGFVLKDMEFTGGGTEITCTFGVFGPTAPDFATAAHT